MAAAPPPRSAEAAAAAAAAAHSRALWLALSLPRGSAPAEATTHGLAAALAAATAGISPPPSSPAAAPPPSSSSSPSLPSGAPAPPPRGPTAATSPPPPPPPPSPLAAAALSALPRLVAAALGFGAGAGWVEAAAAAASADRRALVALLAPGGPLHQLCVAADGGGRAGGCADGPPPVDRGFRVHFPLSNLPPVTRVDVAARVRAAVDGAGGGMGGVGAAAAAAYGGPVGHGGAVASGSSPVPPPSMLGAFAMGRLAAPPGVVPPELAVGAEEYLLLCLVANVVWVGVAPPPPGGGGVGVPPSVSAPGGGGTGGMGAPGGPPGRVLTRSANLPTVRALVNQLLGLWALHFAGAPAGGAAVAAVTAGVPLTAVLRGGPASRRPRHGALFLAAVVDYWLQFSGEAAAVAPAYGGGVPATALGGGGGGRPGGGCCPALSVAAAARRPPRLPWRRRR